MKISFIASAKGGCGKSTFCYQFLAPYLFSNSENKPLVIDFDIANKEAETFCKSTILDCLNCRLIDFDESYFLGEQDIIFDTGATTLAHETLKHFKNKGYLDQITKFFIPLTTGIQACSSALEMYTAIKSYKDDAQICFVLNTQYDKDMLPLEIQFPNFLEDTKRVLSAEIKEGKFNALKGSDPTVSKVVINFEPCLFWSTHLNLTAFEYALRADDLKEKVSQFFKDSKKDPSLLGKYKWATQRFFLANQCQEFRSDLEDQIFKQLDEVFNV